MSKTDYSNAHKLAVRDYRFRVAKGEYPYLPVLDDILRSTSIAGESNLGLVDIPLDFIVGTVPPVVPIPSPAIFSRFWRKLLNLPANGAASVPHIWRKESAIPSRFTNS